MKVSVIISACDNREHLFRKSLDTWARQSIPKKEWEIIVVDDAEREGLHNLCKEYAKSSGINFQFIRIDKKKSKIPVKSFIPALTNNVGFKQAKGEVVVITGPETLQNNSNIAVSMTMIKRKECAYGLVYRASVSATTYIDKQWGNIKNKEVKEMLKIPGARECCMSCPPHPPAYWYYMAVNKKYVNYIGGVDERFLGGLCGEDDDFANRMRFSGVTPVFDSRIIGLHQDHSREDKNDNIHINRTDGLGYGLWEHNYKLMKENIKKKDPIVNKNHDWGSLDLIVLYKHY
jgi:glycosyltransferase involved in cell wall biosynthesis